MSDHSMNAVIVEDEAPAARRLQALLQRSAPDLQVVCILDSVANAAAWFSTHPAPSVAFMDIQLTDGLSFEIFDAVKVSCPVIFTTAFDEYALRAFKVNSIDYLVKPIDQSELERALGKFRTLHGSTREIDLRAVIHALAPVRGTYRTRFLVPVADRFESIRAEEIAFFHSADELTTVTTVDGKTLNMNISLEDLEREIDPDKFFRANRQYLLSYQAIVSVHVYFAGKLKVKLRSSQEEVIVSRERAPLFKEWLGK